MSNNDPFSSSRYNSQSKMTVNGLSCSLNMPKALKQQFQGRAEKSQGLPPYAPRVAFNVDEYENTPDSWMGGSANATSYFTPVLNEHGLWLDFTGNSNHDYHVAVVVSIQGVNAVTGLPVNDYAMEQYKNKCPKHDVEFQSNRYCPKCKFEWPNQNYIATTTGRQLWIDGFRAKDGEVRQFVFTEEEMLGIAQQILGDKKSYAIGVSFFLSKEQKPKPQYTRSTSPFGGFGDVYLSSSGTKSAGDFFLEDSAFELESYGMSSDGAVESGVKGMVTTASVSQALSASTTKSVLRSAPRRATAKKTTLDIRAGAKIDQDLGVDPNDLDFWQDTPAGILYINYTPAHVAKEIIDGGKVEKLEEGFMSSLAVGDAPQATA